MGKTRRNNPKIYTLHYSKKKTWPPDLNRQRDYTAGSWARIWANPLALANSHIWHSSLTEDRKPIKLGCWSSKTQQFQWFQRDQATKTMMELRPCRTCPSTLLLDYSHQSSKESSLGCGESACSPNFCRMKNQAWWENTHDNNKWLIVSSSWSQRGHFQGEAIPSWPADREVALHVQSVTRKNYTCLGHRFSKFFPKVWIELIQWTWPHKLILQNISQRLRNTICECPQPLVAPDERPGPRR
jgi:hypothetical protein